MLSFQKIKPLLESLSQKQEHLKSKEIRLNELQGALEADEQKLEMLQDEIEKIEQEKSQLSQDKETCKQKLDRGIKLLGMFSSNLLCFHHSTYSI